MTHPIGATQGAALIALLTALTALGQFGSNVFLPGLPSIAADLHSTQGEAALAYSLYLAIFGLAQLVAGPLADRWGGRPVALAGAALFTMGGGVAALAASLDALLAGRVVQGLGAAATMVVARSTARALFSGAELARVLATITIAFAVVPGFAPLLGGVLTQWSGWSATLWATVGGGAAVLLWVWLRLPALEAQRAVSGTVLSTYGSLLTDRAFMQMALVGAFAIGAMSTFFGVSPRLFLSVLGVGPVEYGLYPPMAVSGFVIGGLVVRRWSGRLGTTALLRVGVGLQVLGLLLLLLPAALGWLHKLPINAGMVSFVSGLGLLMPVSMAAALSARPSNAGQSAAVLGFLQMALGALGTTLGHLAADLSPALGMQATMALFTVGTLTAVSVGLLASNAAVLGPSKL